MHLFWNRTRDSPPLQLHSDITLQGLLQRIHGKSQRGQFKWSLFLRCCICSYMFSDLQEDTCAGHSSYAQSSLLSWRLRVAQEGRCERIESKLFSEYVSSYVLEPTRLWMEESIERASVSTPPQTDLCGHCRPSRVKRRELPSYGTE